MDTLTDQQLLRDYAESRAEEAFTFLVSRHVNLVYSAALRMVRDAHLAEDVTQSVFIALAQNAGRLMDRPVLSGWLHCTTRNVAANVVRSDVRRRIREQEVVAMNEMLSNNSDATWEQIAPELDMALGELSETDRDALLLRYFEGKSAREMGQRLGISEEAAQKRVNRAIERLREFLSKRGLTVGASGLAAAISANAVQAAPIGLTAMISSTSILAGTALQNAAITATKAIAMTTLQKTLIVTTLALAVGTGIYEANYASHLQKQVQALEPMPLQVEQLRGEREEMVGKFAAIERENERLRREVAGLPKLRGDLARLQKEATELAQLNAGNFAAGDSTQMEITSWLTRVNHLKQRLDQQPGQKIPEFQFVTEQDWLNAARGELKTEKDFRQAFSSLRGAAENKFVPMIQQALQKFKGSTGGFPTAFSQLKPYFESAIDDAILQRWEIKPAENLPDLKVSGTWNFVITQRSPVDEEYDSRFGIGPNGYGSTGTGSWKREAEQAIKTLSSPLKAFSDANNGKEPSDLSELLPYLTTPQQHRALENLVRMAKTRRESNPE